MQNKPPVEKPKRHLISLPRRCMKRIKKLYYACKEKLILIIPEFLYMMQAFVFLLSTYGAAALAFFFLFQNMIILIAIGSLIGVYTLLHLYAIYCCNDDIKALYIKQTDEPEAQQANPENPENSGNPANPVSPVDPLEQPKQVGCTDWCKSALGNCGGYTQIFALYLSSLISLDIFYWYYKKYVDKAQDSYINSTLVKIQVLNAIFVSIPCVMISVVWALNVVTIQSFLNLTSDLTELIFLGLLANQAFGALIGLYYLQFFVQETAGFFDTFLWSLLRGMELLVHSLLIGYFVNLNLMTNNFIALGVLGGIYFIYSVYLFLAFGYWQEWEYSQFYFVDDMTKPKFVLIGIFSTLYGRLLYLTYDESPLLFKTLTCYDSSDIENKPNWRRFYFFLGVAKSPQLRRMWTHTVQAFRIIENFNLILYIYMTEQQNQEIVSNMNAQRTMLYTVGKPLCLVSTGIMLNYYLATAIRTVFFAKQDKVANDE